MENKYRLNKDRERLNELEKEALGRQKLFGVSLIPTFVSWSMLIGSAEAGSDEYKGYYALAAIAFSAVSHILALNMLPREEYLELEKKLSR